MGILDFMNTPESQQWLGLLGAAGPTTDPNQTGIGARIQAGMGYARAAQDAQLKRQQELQQMEMQKMQFAQAQQQFGLFNRVMGNAFGSQQGAATQGQQPSDQPSTSQQPTNPASQPDQSSGMPSSSGTTPAAGSSGQSPSSNFLGLNQNSLLGAMMAGPGELGKAVVAANSPVEFRKFLQQANIDPDSALGRQLMQQNIAKQNYMMPTRLGEGAYADPMGGVQGLPTTAPPGYINVRGQDGQWQTQPVSGGLQAAADSKRAIEGASQGAKIEKVQNSDQTFSYIPNSQLIQGATGVSQPSGGDPSLGRGLDISKMTPDQIKSLAAQDPAAFQAGIQRFQSGAQPSAQQAGPQRFGQTQTEQIQQAGQTAEATRYGGERGALVAEKPVATLAFNDAASNLKRLSTIALDIANHPGLSNTVGLMGALPNVPGSDASDAAAKLETLKSQAAFSVLQAMRNASKSGGALGQVSDKEEVMLANNLVALQKAQSLKSLRDSLLGISAWSVGATERMKNAYDMTYKGSPAIQPAGEAPAAQPQPTPATSTPNPNAPIPMKGMIRGGYRFKGGDPSDQNNWEQQ